MSNDSGPRPAGHFESRDQALRLFEFYENKGFQDKQQMITLTTWLTAFVFALLGFCLTSVADIANSSDLVLLSAGTAASVLSCYTIYVVCEFLDHAEDNYRKADNVIAEIRSHIPKCIHDIIYIKIQSDLGFFRRIFGWRHVGRVFIVLYLWAILIFGSSVATLMVSGYLVYVRRSLVPH